MNDTDRAEIDARITVFADAMLAAVIGDFTEPPAAAIRAAVRKGIAALAPQPAAQATLFESGRFQLHGGEQSDWIINCAALTDADLATLARIAVEIVGPFGSVYGIPRGGERFATELWRHAKAGHPRLVVDDVLTSGGSMRETMRADDKGLVIFARGPLPPNVIALFAHPCHSEAVQGRLVTVMVPPAPSHPCGYCGEQMTYPHACREISLKPTAQPASEAPVPPELKAISKYNDSHRPLTWLDDAQAWKDEAGRLERENDQLRLDRRDALSVTSRDGLLSSEWIARTGKAERERDSARTALAAATAEVERLTDIQRMIEAGREAADASSFGPVLVSEQLASRDALAAELARIRAQQGSAMPLAIRPVDVILYCPKCGTKHVDAPEPQSGWKNPPHKSHLCHACGAVWRPSDIETNGIDSLFTTGSRDTLTRLPWRIGISDAEHGAALAVLNKENADLSRRVWDEATRFPSRAQHEAALAAAHEAGARVLRDIAIDGTTSDGRCYDGRRCGRMVPRHTDACDAARRFVAALPAPAPQQERR